MTEHSPLVSVVTPFYNSERDLARCIESVLAQRYPNFEYVLVDNQSTDGSSEIARSSADHDDRIRLHAHASLTVGGPSFTGRREVALLVVDAPAVSEVVLPSAHRGERLPGWTT